MNNFKDKLKLLLVKNKLTAEQLCDKIGMSKQNLQLIYKRNSMETKNLEKIAEVLGVPVGYFFGEDEQPKVHSNQTTNNMEMEYLKKEIELLKAQIVDKDEIIRLLKEGVVEKFKEQVFKKPESIKQENKTPTPKNITNKITPESVKS